MKQRVIAILPAYNANRTLDSFVKGLPRNLFDGIILVDDCSADGTFGKAKKIQGISAYQTPYNMGYGGNLKFCFSKALEYGADVIVELHPDGEYGCDGINPALSAVQQGARFVLGNRFAHGRPAGMFSMKYCISALLTYIYNVLLGTRIPDMHQGFRVYTRLLLKSIPWKDFSNDFLFSFQMIVAARKHGIPIAAVPVTARYKGSKRGATWLNTIRYTVGTFFAVLPVKKQNHSQCPLCKTDMYAQQMYSIKKFGIFYCFGCQIGFTVPQPKDMSRYYPSQLAAVKRRLLPHAPRRQTAWFRRFVSGGNILDVGSGEGRFAKSLPRRYRVTNLDPYSKHADVSTFNKGRFENQSFDAVVFWESLEHTKDPIDCIEKTYALLRPGGHMVVEYPRFESLDRRLFGRYWLHLDIPRHLFHFSSHGLLRIVEKSGFDVLINRPVFAWEYGTWVGLLVAQKPTTMVAHV